MRSARSLASLPVQVAEVRQARRLMADSATSGKIRTARNVPATDERNLFALALARAALDDLAEHCGECLSTLAGSPSVTSIQVKPETLASPAR
jgi:hypothetical protein